MLEQKEPVGLLWLQICFVKFPPYYTDFCFNIIDIYRSYIGIWYIYILALAYRNDLSSFPHYINLYHGIIVILITLGLVDIII